MQPVFQTLPVLDLVPFGQMPHGSKFFALRLADPGWKEWRPGQFLMLRPPDFGLETPWGRPFCICHLSERHLVCFFEVRGKGTEKIARLKPGDMVSVWGPLGNWFAVEKDRPTLLLAGGMGIAPFVGYAAAHPQPWNLSMLFGHRRPADCYPLDGINRHIPVDSLREDGSGDLDNFLFTMQEKMRDCAEQDGLVLACGPEPFLRAVRKHALELGCRCQLSVERRMACGIGACLGCAVRASDGSLVQTCARGPIFEATDVIL